MITKRILLMCAAMIYSMAVLQAQTNSYESFPLKAPYCDDSNGINLKTNVLLWGVAVPNISAEYTFKKKWSANMDILYCPWKISDSFSIKTAALLPEGRYWLKNNHEGSFFNMHFTLAWYNVRFGKFRYQDDGRLLVGGGFGYGYRLFLTSRFGLEFTLGAGIVSTRYDRYFNVADGALRDTRSTLYFGIDRIGISLVYNLCGL